MSAVPPPPDFESAAPSESFAPAGPDGTAAPMATPAPVSESAVETGPAPHHQLVVPRTRASGAWAGVAVGLFVLLLVIVFIAQNTSDAPLHFLWLHGSVPVGLAILLAFVLGGIVVLLVGAARLTQLRLMARRHRRHGTPPAPTAT